MIFVDEFIAIGSTVDFAIINIFLVVVGLLLVGITLSYCTLASSLLLLIHNDLLMC